jgi:peptide/nickel transport system ATP-binding protein
MSAADARRFPRNLSGGQRQRIAAARALAARPDLLIGDEPISALDASTQASVAYLMTRMAQDQGTALLFISHDLSIVRLIADRLIVMYRGHVVERGPTDQVWADPRHPYTRALLGAIPAPDGEGTLPLAAEAGTDYPLEELSF